MIKRKLLLVLGMVGLSSACTTGEEMKSVLTDLGVNHGEEAEPVWPLKEGAKPHGGYMEDTWKDPDTGCTYKRHLVDGATIWITLEKPESELSCQRYFVPDYTKDPSDWEKIKGNAEELKATIWSSD
jgi:hypothetical protein